MSLEDKIQSIRSVISNESFIKPEKEKLDGFIKALKENRNAQDYLLFSRGISKETADHFKLGYDETKNAIVIPVFKRGELINLRYRYLDPEKKPKYTQEKGCEIWLYNDDGISKGLKKGMVLIVEGEFDLMSAWQAGFKAVISPASGKDSYGVWLEALDAIPKVYIAYDNDKPGKGASIKLADRIGVEKCSEISYPEGIKDANEYFQKHQREDFIELYKNAQPFYKHTYKNLIDIISSVNEIQSQTIKLDTIPYVKFGEDWVAVISGISGVGKTSYVMNVASELANKDIPTLILPFERGIKTVGMRFLQINNELSETDIEFNEEKDWKKIIESVSSLPIYFSMPSLEDYESVIARAKRLFDIKVVIVDHLDYFVRGEDKFRKQADVIQKFKDIAQENNIIFLVVHHIKKQQNMSGASKKPKMEDLSGASEIYKIPEAVIMLHCENKNDIRDIEVIIDKNKGKHGSKVFSFNSLTGKISLSENQKTFDNI